MDFHQLQRAVLTLDKATFEQQTTPSDYGAESRTGVNIIQYSITVIDKMKMSFEDILDVCLSRGVKLNHQNVEGLTALHIAVAHKQAIAFDALIRKGAEVDVVDKDGFTPLYLAVCNYRGEQNMLNIINTLVSIGADLNRKNAAGVSAIYYAKHLGLVSIKDTIPKHGI